METQKTKSTILHILQLTMEETLQDPRYFYDDENEDYQDDIFDLFIYLASTDEAGRSNQAGRKKRQDDVTDKEAWNHPKWKEGLFKE